MDDLVTVIKGNCEYSYSKEISSEQLVERQGLKYEINSIIPFTGTVTHSQYFGLTSQRINYKDGKLDGVWEEYQLLSGEVLQKRSNFKRRNYYKNIYFILITEVFNRKNKLAQVETKLFLSCKGFTASITVTWQACQID